ncbi:MAG: murein biosynthesis integral membrane protein MurJ [Chloroflexota bacterium]
MTQQTKHITYNTIVVMAAFAADKLLALVRDWVIARRFGAGMEYDAFSAAIQAPELLYTLLAGGALLAAFIPVMSKEVEKPDPEARWLLASRFANIVSILLLLSGLFIAIWSRSLVQNWIAPDFSLEKQELTASILRIVMIQTFIFGVAGIAVGSLHAHKHFFLPALAPLFYNLGQIVGALLLAPHMGIEGLVWGMVIGAVLYLGILFPGLVRYGARYFSSFGLDDEKVRLVLRLMVPRIVMLGMVEFADLVIVRVGSALPDGHLSSYFWGWRLMQLPETLIGTAIGQVVFPTLAEHYGKGNLDEYRKRMNSSIQTILYLSMLSSVPLVFLATPILSQIGGALDHTSIVLIRNVLVFFAFRLVGESLLEVAARSFYAQQNTRVPMYASILGQGLGIVLYLELNPVMGIRGIALASAIAYLTETFVLLLWLRRTGKGMIERDLVFSLLRCLGGVAVATTIAYLVSHVLGRNLWQLESMIPSLLIGASYLAAYIIATAAVGSREPANVLRMIRKIVSKYRQGTRSQE